MQDLNPEQKKAVEFGDGPLLIIAGPGSGKTRVITQRMVHLLTSSADTRLAPQNILALTFTEKAALEMKGRVKHALPQIETTPLISTFHSFCYELLRKRHFDRQLLDKTDVWIFLRRRMEYLGLRYYQKLAEPGAFLHSLNEFFSRCQDALVGPEEFDSYMEECRLTVLAAFPNMANGLKRAFPTDSSNLQGNVTPDDPLKNHPLNDDERAAWDELLRLFELARVFHKSRELLDHEGCSSLGSLISEAVALLVKDPDLRDSQQRQWRCVMVDEFQDTNYGQVELLKLLVASPFRITAVGDDDQAIYRFRGASHGAFKMFSDAFPGHQTIYLNRNYRSTARILRVAEAVIAGNPRYENKPKLIAALAEGRPVYLMSSKSFEGEAAGIAAEVCRLASRGTPLGEIAVMYRAHGYRDLLVAEFRQCGIPFAIRGLSILASPLIRDLVAYLRVIHSRGDSVSLTRVLLTPRWRVSKQLAQAMREFAAQSRCSLFESFEESAKSRTYAREIESSGWPEFESMAGNLHRSAFSMPVTEVFNRLKLYLALDSALRPSDRVLLGVFEKFLGECEKKSETRRLAEFMEYFDFFLEAGGRIEAPDPPEADQAVQMMTIHAAKGLEFPVVFLIGVAARRFPSLDRKPVIEFPVELSKGPLPPGDIHLQEERRLFYVAITRAKDRLYISGVAKSERQKSRFVTELTADLALAARDIERIELPEVLPPGDLETPVVAAEKPGLPGFVPNDLPPSRSGGVENGQSSPERRSSSSSGPQQTSLFGDDPPPRAVLPALAEFAHAPATIERDGEMRLSATAIEEYLSCPLKFKFNHLLRVPGAAAASLTFGSVMHQAVRHYFEKRRESLPSQEWVEDHLLRSWKSTGYDDKYQEETYKKAGLEQLRKFVERHNAIAFDARAIRCEQGFCLELDKVKLEGRIDQLNPIPHAPADAVELVDYKTGRPRSAKDAENSLQLSVYALAARDQMGLNPVRLTFYNLTNNQSISTTRNAQQMKQTLDQVYEVAQNIRNGRFSPNPGLVCKWCDYFTICPAHEEQA